MPSQKEINEQLSLLRIYRANLHNFLKNQAKQGPAHTTPDVANGIVESREEIQRVKNILRGWGVIVEEHPDDEDEPTGAEPRSHQLEVPFVTIAMTQSEAATLLNDSTTSTFSVSNQRFKEFQELLEVYDIELDGLKMCYGEERDDWKPYLGGENKLTIHEIIVELIDNVNKLIEGRLSISPVRVRSFSEEFFTRDSFLRPRYHRQLSLSNCIFIIDPISLFHPYLAEILALSGMGYSEKLAVLMVSPIELNKVYRSVENEIRSHIPWAITRYEDVFLDKLCELHIESPLAFQRRFFSIISEVMNQQPKMHPMYQDSMMKHLGPRRGSSKDWFVR